MRVAEGRDTASSQTCRRGISAEGGWTGLALALACLTSYARAAVATSAACSNPLEDPDQAWDYSQTFASSRTAGISFTDLPGFTRSTYKRDHALVTPESRVFAPLPGWQNALTAHLISPAAGASFAMFLADLKADSSSAPPTAGAERFVFVLEGSVSVSHADFGGAVELQADSYAFLPPGSQHSIESSAGAGLLVFERLQSAAISQVPKAVHGTVSERPVLPVDGEVFALRKLLPSSAAYDFNIHIMDFRPGEFLNVKEVHYNQHGLLLLQGQGIYRLADEWYPVQAGDAIWMAPYVVQWYAALGTHSSRYILYKDTIEDPLAYAHGGSSASNLAGIRSEGTLR